MAMILTPAEAGLRRTTAPLSPVLRLGLAYFARVAGFRRRDGSCFPRSQKRDPKHLDEAMP